MWSNTSVLVIKEIKKEDEGRKEREEESKDKRKRKESLFLY